MKAKGEAVPNERLRDERERRHWSQAHLAREIETYAFMVHRWEHGHTFPAPHYRQKLSKLFEKSAEELGLVPPETGDDDTGESALAQASFSPSSVAVPLYDPMIPSSLAGSAGLIGRDELLHALKQHLFAGHNLALCALNGMPGVGKTALAIELAHDSRVRDHFHDGLLWAGLGPRPNIMALLGRWCTLLGITSAQATIEDWKKAISTVIGTRQMLLVLDDAWHIEVPWPARWAAPTAHTW